MNANAAKMLEHGHHVGLGVDCGGLLEDAERVQKGGLLDRIQQNGAMSRLLSFSGRSKREVGWGPAKLLLSGLNNRVITPAQSSLISQLSYTTTIVI